MFFEILTLQNVIFARQTDFHNNNHVLHLSFEGLKRRGFTQRWEIMLTSEEDL